MKTSRKLIYMLATVLTALLPVGCSQSNDNDPDAPDFEEGIPTEVTITLSARSGNATRADLPPDGTPKDPTSSIELIHDWWLVFVNKNKVLKIIKREEVEDKTISIPSSVTDPNGGFEAETFKIILPSGTYRIYAFANIPAKTAEEFEKFRDTKNSTEWKHKTINLDSFIEINRLSNSPNDSMQWHPTYAVEGKDLANNIPMSAVMTNKKISNTVEEAFNIELIRTVAKVEFEFRNPSADNITLNSLTFGPVSNSPGKISIIPNNEAVGIMANNKLENDDIKTGTLSIGLNSHVLNAGDNHSFDFYCHESLSLDDSGNRSINGKGFDIELTVTKGVGEDAKTKTKQLKTSKITYINRNDWIHIPIVFNDWKIYWKLHYYPPIGGYPPVFNQNDDGSSLSATLTTGGEFELYPVKIEQNGNLYDLSKIDWQTVEVSVESGSELFSVLPAKIDNPGNNSDHPANTEKIIAGEMKEKVTGDATVKITFKLKDNEASSTLFTCLFTIHRQNSAPSN